MVQDPKDPKHHAQPKTEHDPMANTPGWRKVTPVAGAHIGPSFHDLVTPTMQQSTIPPQQPVGHRVESGTPGWTPIKFDKPSASTQPTESDLEIAALGVDEFMYSSPPATPVVKPTAKTGVKPAAKHGR